MAGGGSAKSRMLDLVTMRACEVVLFAAWPRSCRRVDAVSLGDLGIPGSNSGVQAGRGRGAGVQAVGQGGWSKVRASSVEHNLMRSPSSGIGRCEAGCDAELLGGVRRI